MKKALQRLFSKRTRKMNQRDIIEYIQSDETTHRAALGSMEKRNALLRRVEAKQAV